MVDPGIIDSMGMMISQEAAATAAECPLASPCVDLGITAMKVKDILKQKGEKVYTISPDQLLTDAVAKLVEHNVGSLVVCEGDQLVGIITERDILRACDSAKAAFATHTVRQHMSTELTTGGADAELAEVMGAMTVGRMRHLPILHEGRLAGMISIGDVVKAEHGLLSVENHYLKTYIRNA